MTEGEVGLLHVDTEGGALTGLMPFHPTTYTVKWVKRNGVVEKEFQIQGETEPRYSDSFTQILGLSIDGMFAACRQWCFFSVDPTLGGDGDRGHEHHGQGPTHGRSCDAKG